MVGDQRFERRLGARRPDWLVLWLLCSTTEAASASAPAMGVELGRRSEGQESLQRPSEVFVVETCRAGPSSHLGPGRARGATVTSFIAETKSATRRHQRPLQPELRLSCAPGQDFPATGMLPSRKPLRTAPPCRCAGSCWSLCISVTARDGDLARLLDRPPATACSRVLQRPVDRGWVAQIRPAGL